MANMRVPGGKVPAGQSAGDAGKALDKKKADNREAKMTAKAAAMAADDDPDIDGDADGPDVLMYQRMLKRRKGAGIGGIDDMRELFADSEAEADSGAATAMGITRKGGSGHGHGDGFDDDSRRREAYEQMLMGNITDDNERFAQLSMLGSEDFFNPELDPATVEMLGLRAAGHMVRMYDYWMVEGADRFETINRAAEFLAKFGKITNVRRVLNELECAPIRDIYALEVMVHMLDNMPESIEGVKEKPVIQNLEQLSNGEGVFAGHTFKVRVPKNMKLKAFALLGGGRPGYEFYPAPKEGVFNMEVDTPGTWNFALLAVPTKKVGRIQKEDSKEARVQRFTVTVKQMDKKGQPLLVDDDGQAATT